MPEVIRVGRYDHLLAETPTSWETADFIGPAAL
jgi:hypothetical protein